MPNAIEGVYLFDKEENPIFHTKQEIMNILSNQANESVQHINEWKPENMIVFHKNKTISWNGYICVGRYIA